MPLFSYNAFLLVAEAVLYFAVLTTLFRLRHHLGFGLFVAALGATHFLETYLAAILYVEFPAGIVFSPGSTILFAGKLAMLLLVYIREDASAVRQPIYGLLIANFMMVGLVALLRQHDALAALGERTPDFRFMDEMGGLMVWGTILLFVDAIGIILLYEKSSAWLGNRVWLRVWLSLSVMLTVDQLGFYAALYLIVEAPASVLVGGWIGKMFAAAVYAFLVSVYLRFFEQTAGPLRYARLIDVFDVLTYRERYEALLQRAGRDALTGALDRGRLDEDGARQLEESNRLGKPTSVIVVDIDHFKSINDRHGHAGGDEVLRLIAKILADATRDGDRVYRYGGDEFVVVCDGMPHGLAMIVAEHIRRTIAIASALSGKPATASIGVATAPEDARNFEGLFAIADRRLYKTKSSGRDRVVGQVPRDVSAPQPHEASGAPAMEQALRSSGRN